MSTKRPPAAAVPATDQRVAAVVKPLFKVIGFNGRQAEACPRTPMARPAAKSEEEQSAALDARLKGAFDALKAEPVPARLLRHVEKLEAAASRKNGKKP